jgi:hypothetical protein
MHLKLCYAKHDGDPTKTMIVWLHAFIHVGVGIKGSQF